MEALFTLAIPVLAYYFTFVFYVLLQHTRVMDLFPANIVDYRIELLSDHRILAKCPMQGCPECPFRRIYRCSGQSGHRNIREIHMGSGWDFYATHRSNRGAQSLLRLQAFCSLYANNHMMHGIRRSIHVFLQDLQHRLPVDIDRLQPVLHPIIC